MGVVAVVAADGDGLLRSEDDAHQDSHGGAGHRAEDQLPVGADAGLIQIGQVGLHILLDGSPNFSHDKTS